MKKASKKSKVQVPFPKDKIAEFCRRYHIKKLAVFGSVLGPDFRADSDIDVLVEFEPDHIPGLAFFAMEDELSAILGRKVDLNTPQCLSRYFRDKVLQEAVVQYGEG
ncbi:MAG: nucleotidyltransferase family protein [Syntrophales bacterium]|nr:nucleotidyltransferase family protein [Syntrophales bacterium]MDD5642782.1 nucleotidyltransferase family protein [Syntrophales bacterium]